MRAFREASRTYTVHWLSASGPSNLTPSAQAQDIPMRVAATISSPSSLSMAESSSSLLRMRSSMQNSSASSYTFLLACHLFILVLAHNLFKVLPVLRLLDFLVRLQGRAHQPRPGKAGEHGGVGHVGGAA